MKINDKAYVVINTSQINRTLSAFGHEEKVAKKILIIGGGNIGFNLAKILEATLEGARVKIIEKNKERAELIASEMLKLQSKEKLPEFFEGSVLKDTTVHKYIKTKRWKDITPKE